MIGINVGPYPDSIREARESICEILSASADQDTIRTALECFKELCAVRNTTIQNCTFTVPKEGQSR